MSVCYIGYWHVSAKNSKVWHNPQTTRKLCYRKDDRAMRLIRYCRFCAPARHFFPPTSSLPKISPCSPGSRWMTLGYEKGRCWANCSLS